MPMSSLRIVVCGSGNGAQTAAGMLGHQGHSVWLYMSPQYSNRAAALQAAINDNDGAISITSHDGDIVTSYSGPVQGVFTAAADIVPAADIVIISVTGPAMPALVKELAPHLRSHQLLLYLQGMGAVNYLQLSKAVYDAQVSTNNSTCNPLIKPKSGWAMPAMPIYASAKILPWACRVQSPANVTICGTKKTVAVAVAKASPLLACMVPHLLSSLFTGTSFWLSSSPLDDSFFPYSPLLNPVIHPGIMYGTWNESSWDGKPLPNKPSFYHSVSPAACEAVEGLTADAQAVYDVMCRQVLGIAQPGRLGTVREDLVDRYGSLIGDSTSLYSTLRTNAAHRGIFHPMKPAAAVADNFGCTSSTGWVPDFGCRLLSEDLPCGLVPMKGVADILGVSTPWLDRVIAWGQEKLGKEYVVGGRLVGRNVGETNAPQAYGVTLKAQLDIRRLVSDMAAKLSASAATASTAAVAAEDIKPVIAAGCAASSAAAEVLAGAAAFSSSFTAIRSASDCQMLLLRGGSFTAVASRAPRVC